MWLAVANLSKQKFEQTEATAWHSAPQDRLAWHQLLLPEDAEKPGQTVCEHQAHPENTKLHTHRETVAGEVFLWPFVHIHNIILVVSNEDACGVFNGLRYWGSRTEGEPP
jgi:hypothetical protein